VGLDYDQGPEKKKCLTGVGNLSEEAGAASTFSVMILNTMYVSQIWNGVTVAILRADTAALLKKFTCL
jgi:hypothetical protein